jgi:hypothetical protein
MERIRISNIKNLIEGYVRGPLNISKAKMTLPREEGGVGLFSVTLFLAGQICTWAKRAHSLDNHWKLRLYKNSLGSTLNLRAKFYTINAEPILHNIATKMEKFHENLTTKKTTYWSLSLWITPLLRMGEKILRNSMKISLDRIILRQTGTN